MTKPTIDQTIFAEGEARGRLLQARRMLLRWGERRIGPASDVDRGAIELINDFDRLDRMCDLALDAGAKTWDEFWLLVGPDDAN